MKLAGLTFNELTAILNRNGYFIESDAFWDKHNRIIFKKGRESIILQFDTYYGFPFVYTFLSSLDIEIPDHCKKPYDQYMAMRDKHKPNNN